MRYVRRLHDGWSLYELGSIGKSDVLEAAFVAGRTDLLNRMESVLSLLPSFERHGNSSDPDKLGQAIKKLEGFRAIVEAAYSTSTREVVHEAQGLSVSPNCELEKAFTHQHLKNIDEARSSETAKKKMWEARLDEGVLEDQALEKIGKEVCDSFNKSQLAKSLSASLSSQLNDILWSPTHGHGKYAEFNSEYGVVWHIKRSETCYMRPILCYINGTFYSLSDRGLRGEVVGSDTSAGLHYIARSLASLSILIGDK